jgi:hypothetical protein
VVAPGRSLPEERCGCAAMWESSFPNPGGRVLSRTV